MYHINGISIHVLPTQAAAAEFAANQIARQVVNKPTSVLGFCTGSTAEPVYAHLVDLHRRKLVSFHDVVTFNLDEYYPISPDHVQSYARFMRERLFDSIDVNPRNTHIPDGAAADPQAAVIEYERLLGSFGPIDLLFAGVGLNTHIGFNEPPTCRTSRTRLVALTEETRLANSRFFSSLCDVPSQSITMGIGNVCEAQAVILCAFGSAKAEAVLNTLTAPPSEETPGAFIQGHPNCMFVMDSKAAALLR